MIPLRPISRLLCGVLAVGFAARADEFSKAADPVGAPPDQRACEYVRARLGFSPGTFLRAVRREDFEDDLFGAQVKIRGQIHKAAWFFDVTEYGYEIPSPNEVFLHSSVDGARRWVVAVSSTSGQVYGLAGFDGSIRDFNRLAEDSIIRILSEESATAWANFFLKVVISDANGFWLSGPFSLRRAVEDIIEGHALTRKHSITASRWLKNLRSHNVKPVIGMAVQKQGEAYQVVADSVSASPAANDFIPVLKETKFRILQEGVVADETVVNLFPVSSGSI